MTTLPTSLTDAAHHLLQALWAQTLTVATAESCTGGLISSSLTAIAGSSNAVDRGFVTYSDQAKIDMLGVDPALIRQHGAVSQQVALAMVAGTLDHSPADLALAVTGIAGPGGGSADKPVGLVFISAQRRGQPPQCQRMIFAGDRDGVRHQTVIAALALGRQLI